MTKRKSEAIKSEAGLESEPTKKGKQGPKKPKDADNPFPNHTRPNQEECHAARDGLALLHGDPGEASADASSEHPDFTILDSLVRTILSQNTTDTNSSRTFANLKKEFGEWEEVRTAPPEKVEAAIKLGGLAAVKTERIKDILNSVKAEQGSCTLEHLRKLSNDEIKESLLQYKGVGPKTAACVLMFSLGRHEFPVDTHVWRIAKNLGWVPKSASREETYAHLNTRIPDKIKFALHVLMVEHGKRCERCAKNGKPRKESQGPCPLVNLAHSAIHSKTLDAESAAEAAEAVLKEGDLVKEEASGVEDKPNPVKKENFASSVKDEPFSTSSHDDKSSLLTKYDKEQVKLEGGPADKQIKVKTEKKRVSVKDSDKQGRGPNAGRKTRRTTQNEGHG